MPQPVPGSQTPLEPAPLHTQPGQFGQVAAQLPGGAPASLGGLEHQANAGLVQNHHSGNKKVGCPICRVQSWGHLDAISCGSYRHPLQA